MFQHTYGILQNIQNALTLFKQSIFPALFPFFIISHLMIDCGFLEIGKEITKPISSLFHLPPASSFILAMSFLSGSPSNAIFTKNLYLQGELTKEEAEKTLTFTYFSSPLFVLGTVSILYLKNQKLGLLLFFIHLITGLFTGFFYQGNVHTSPKPNLKRGLSNMLNSAKEVPLEKSITKSIEEAMHTMLLILGSICFIYVVTAIIEPYFPKPYFPFLKGLLEVTQGLQAVSDFSFFYQGLFSLLFLSFGGISIHIQIISILSDTDLSIFPFLKARILHVLFSCILYFLLFPLI